MNPRFIKITKSQVINTASVEFASLELDDESQTVKLFIWLFNREEDDDCIEVDLEQRSELFKTAAQLNLYPDDIN